MSENNERKVRTAEFKITLYVADDDGLLLRPDNNELVTRMARALADAAHAEGLRPITGLAEVNVVEAKVREKHEDCANCDEENCLARREPYRGASKPMMVLGQKPWVVH